MHFDTWFIDGNFDLEDWNCLFGMLAATIICATICFLFVRHSLQSTRGKLLTSRNIISSIILISVITAVSTELERMLAGIFASLSAHAEPGQTVSIGYPFGSAPIWSTLFGCVLAVVVAVYFTKRKSY